MKYILMMYITLFSTIIAGIINMVFCKASILSKIQTPIDEKKLFIDGKRIFVFNGGVQSNNPEFDRGVKCLKENQYSFDYVLSNHSMLSTVIYFRHNERNIDLSKQYFLDKYLVKAEFKQYIFAKGPPLCPLVKLVNDKTVFELQ